MHILFVCTGNICRSPTAERLTLAWARQSQTPGLRASSAGTRAVIGHPIHSDAAQVLRDLGGESSGFAARQLTARIAADADIVLAMTREHRDSVLELAPQKFRKTFTLAEAARLVTECGAQTVIDLPDLRSQLSPDGEFDVHDPIGQDADVFAAVGTEIADLLAPVVDLCLRTLEPGGRG